MTDLNPPIFQLLFTLSPLWFCFGCGCLFFRGLAARNLIGKDWRVCWAFTLLLTGCLCAGITECAGALRQLTRGTVLGAWLAVDAALLAAVVRMHKPTPEKIRAALREGWRQFSMRPATGSLSRGWIITLFVLAAAMALVVGVVALQCPPNVWDSMTYHVPRVMHWLQQHSLADYPTNIIRQLESAPGAEQQTSTLMLLSGNDWALNLPQWWALATCAAMAGLMAERFCGWHFGKTPLDPGKVRFCGLFAALIAMTIPAGIPDAISTQNDYLAAQWVMLLGVFGLLLAQEPANRFYALGVAAAFALGINNKPTMFINAAPFVLGLAVWLLRKSLRMLLTLGLAMAVFALAVNLPWMTRNDRVFHNPLGSQDTRKIQTLADHAPAKLAANILRNLGLYASTPFAPVTDGVHRIFLGLFKAIGEPPQDTGSVWHDTVFYLPPNAEAKNDDGFGGMMTVLPVLLGTVFFLIKFKWKSPLAVYLGLVMAGFALFSGYLKWQPWHPRLHLPFFMMAAPFAGMVLGWVWNRWCVLVAALLLVLNALLVLYYNFQYPIFQLSDERFKTREERYFCRRPELYPGTAEVARDLVSSGVTNVLLKIGGDTWEYPLWVCLKDRGFQGTIEHAFVENESTPLGAPNLDWPGTAVLCEDAEAPALPDFPLTVTYAFNSWSVHYRGKPDNRIKLISNQFLAPVAVRQAARLEIRCNVIDQNGQLVTNNIIRVRTSDFSRDYPLTAGPLVLECPLKPGQNMMGIFLVNPPTPEQRILTLANVTSSLKAP